jgi:mRNA interferase RelE/StbE
MLYFVVIEIRYTATALKALRRLPRNVSDAVRQKLLEVAEDPASARNVRKLKGREGFRLRVGDWRVVYVFEGAEGDAVALVVIAVGPRGGVYD